MIKECTNEEVNSFEKLISYFRTLADDGVTPLIEKQLLLMLQSAIDFQCHLIEQNVFPELIRLTINKKILGENKRIYDLNQLKYPPSDWVKSYGRCNMPGQSILYGGFNLLTIYSELKPVKGDLITISKWRVKNDSPLTFCPIFLHQPYDGTMNLNTYNFEKRFLKSLKDYPENVSKRILLLNHFISEVFAKKFFNNSNDLNYIFSAYFSDKILNEYYNGQVDAILYPSVRQGLSFENIAIKPVIFDAKYDIVEVKESIVVMDHTTGQRGTLTEGINTCRSFDLASNQILWPAHSNQSKEKIEYYKRYYGYGEGTPT